MHIVLPIHGSDKICCIGDQSSPIITDQIITALGIFSVNTTREGKDIPAVTLGNLCRDEPTTLCGTLNENNTIRHTCHDTVATHEIGLIGIRKRHELRQQSTVIDHFRRCITMAVWIYLIQTMRQHTYGLIALCQCFTVGIDIYSVGQATDNEKSRAIGTQIANQTTDQVLAVLSNPPCSDNTDNLCLVQVTITFII